jgi:hypothetical protein
MLLQSSYGRAALMKGGIIACIARDVLSDHAETIIGLGPLDSATRYGMALQIGSNYYWGDDLMEEEEEILCGVYKISTGM